MNLAITVSNLRYSNDNELPWSLFKPLFSLFCYITALGQTNTTDWIVLLLGLFEEPWYIVGLYVANYIINVFCKAGIIQVTRIILHTTSTVIDYVTRFLEIYRVICLTWRRPRERPPVTWLRRINRHCQVLRMAERAHAWHNLLLGLPVVASTSVNNIISSIDYY